MNTQRQAGMGVKIAVIVSAIVLGIVPLSAHAATILAEMTEDFSHSDWSDGVDSGDNGWTIRAAETHWSYEDTIGNEAPSLRPTNSNVNEHWAAKNHALGTDPNGFWYRLKADILGDDLWTFGQVLLGDASGNGYMIRYAATSPNLLLQVYETAGGTIPLGIESPLPNYTPTLLGEDPFKAYSLGDFYTLNMDLRQAGAGQPFTITAWVDGYGSAESPLLTFTDTRGDGLDLADLVKVAFTGRDQAYFDNITVQLIPEPARGTLIAIQ